MQYKVGDEVVAMKSFTSAASQDVIDPGDRFVMVEYNTLTDIAKLKMPHLVPWKSEVTVTSTELLLYFKPALKKMPTIPVPKSLEKWYSGVKKYLIGTDKTEEK